MWNRVALLSAGFAFGWTLAHYWATRRALVRRHLLRGALAAAVGLLLVVWLSLSASPASGLAGALVFGLAALVAYAANAKQVSKGELFLSSAAWPSLVQRGTGARGTADGCAAGGEAESRRVVLLIHDGEPAVYDGPAPWARRFARLQAEGQAVPHWFVRPPAYARIRSAYDRMGGATPLSAATANLAQELQRLLGLPYAVGEASLWAEPPLAERLASLAREGAARIVLLTLDLDANAQELLREQVTQSRVREAGVALSFASHSGLFPPSEERLARLLRGEPPAPAEPVTAERVRALHETVVASEPR